MHVFWNMAVPRVIILPITFGDTAFGTARMVIAAFTVHAVNVWDTEFLLDEEVSY